MTTIFSKIKTGIKRLFKPLDHIVCKCNDDLSLCGKNIKKYQGYEDIPEDSAPYLQEYVDELCARCVAQHSLECPRCGCRDVAVCYTCKQNQAL